MFRSLLMLAALTVASSSAATLTYSFALANCPGCNINFPALATTNWAGNVTVPKFDPTLGNLQSVSVTLKGSLDGDIQIESLDAAPTTITSTLLATITLTRPDTSTIVVVIPQVQLIDNVTAFDGNIDFGGGSGRTYANQGGSASSTHVSPPPISDLALFSGVGNIVLPIGAVASSGATGAGNLLALIRTRAGAEVEVTYTFDDGVPEPATFVLIGGGLIGLAFLRRRG
ncbi:MAG: PEP-CTERM sorting domain-containing protein [Acidobacteria bacterium]|nr:PEP-CTERM sorting domain-containing protein [Acidobacteriota bacterium]